MACTDSFCECLRAGQISLSATGFLREPKTRNRANDGWNGESSVERTSLAAGTRYNLPEVQGLVPSPKSKADNSKIETSTGTQQLVYCRVNLVITSQLITGSSMVIGNRFGG